MIRLSSRLLLLFLSASLAAHAQLDSCAKQVDIASEAEIASIAACSTFSGSVTISGAGINAVVWPALKSLTGSIKVTSNPHLAALHFDGLKASTGTITLFNNTILSVIDMPNLQSINSLEIVTAPNLRQFSLSSVETINSLRIEDTGLDNSGTLPWSHLHQAIDLGVSNNKFLRTIDMPSLKSVSGKLVIAANGLMEGEGQGSSLLLSNLTTCSNCTFRHLTELKVPSLSAVSASLSFDETNLEKLDVPALKSVGQTLSIVSNNVLSNISFAELTSIGGALLIANNTELTTIDGFQNLKDIAGVLNMRGTFINISLPHVSSVQGGMSVLSSSNDFDCSTLAKVKASARGKTVCQAKVVSAKPTNADGTLVNAGTATVGDLSMGSAFAAIIMTAAATLFF
ncbi:hypothetical protein BGZ82_000342 [Podila clonocystis]|nr:hypothetical protein BGZ82_000342 [Podila clonocystis]